MSDSLAKSHNDASDKAQHPAGHGGSGDAWAQISRESNAHPMTDLKGRVCRVQPKEDQQAMLKSGHKPKGCDFKTFDPKTPEGSSILKARDTAMHIEVPSTDHGRKGTAVGSGVIIGQSGDKCLLATDNHVVGGVKSMHVDSIILHKDGVSYPAKKEITDEPNDRAVLSFKFPKGDPVCKPAPFADSADQKGKVVATGFPEDSDALTAAPGASNGLAKMNRVLPPLDPKIKMADNQHRDILDTKANTLEGMSGGPIWNSKSEVSALVGGGIPGVNDLTYGNPVTKSDVSRWIKQVDDKDNAARK